MLSLLLFRQVRVEIQRAKLELSFELNRLPTQEEIIKKVGISPSRYHEVMRASKPVSSLHAKHRTTQQELIDELTDTDGVAGDERQPALLRLALDDVVTTYLLWSCILLNCILPLFVRLLITYHQQAIRNELFGLQKGRLTWGRPARSEWHYPHNRHVPTRMSHPGRICSPWHKTKKSLENHLVWLW